MCACVDPLPLLLTTLLTSSLPILSLPLPFHHTQERRSAALLRLAGVDPDNTGDVSRLHSTFLSAQTVLGAAVAAETEAEA